MVLLKIQKMLFVYYKKQSKTYLSTVITPVLLNCLPLYKV